MPPNTPNGIITQYSLQSGDMTSIASLNSNFLMFTVGAFPPLTMYELQLRAHTSAGVGLPSSVTAITSEFIKMYHGIVWMIVI